MFFYNNKNSSTLFFSFAKQAYSPDPSFSSNVQAIKFNAEVAKDAQRAQRGYFELPSHCLSQSEKTRLALLFVYHFALRYCVKFFNADSPSTCKESKKMNKGEQIESYFKSTLYLNPQRPLRTLGGLCVKFY